MSLLQLSSGFAPPQYHFQPSLGGEPLPQVIISIVVDLFIKIIRLNIITVSKINISVIIVLIVAGGERPPKVNFVFITSRTNATVKFTFQGYEIERGSGVIHQYDNHVEQFNFNKE